MTTYSLILDADTLEKEPERPVVGAVYVEFDGKPFPAKGWMDFALDFLTEYIRAVTALGQTSSESTVHYMLRFSRKGPVVVIEALKDDKVVHVAETSFEDFLKHILFAISQVRAGCAPLVSNP